MTVGELRAALVGLPDDMKVVVDVDAEWCISDRNVLEVEGVRNDDVDTDLRWLFVQASSKGASFEPSWSRE